MKTKYTKEMLGEVVSKSFSMRQVLNELGLTPSGGNHTHIKRRIKDFDISTDHFTGQLWSKGKKIPSKNPERLLVLRDKGDPITNGGALRKSLIALGVAHECSICKQVPEWNGKPLVLPVDHVNGVRWDNRLENLRFLCPNCHAQTETFSGKKNGKS